MVNFDWRDIFRTSFSELKEKLDRDQLNTDINDFFFFSWAHASYAKLEGRFKTLHIRTGIYKLKPLLDLITAIRVPFAVRKYHVKPDVWMTYDFGMLPALWLARRKFGGKIVMFVSNQPRVYSRTRRFGAVKSLYSRLVEKLWKAIPDHYFTINENMRGYLLAMGIPGAKISVCYVNTIDRDKRHIVLARKGSVRFGLGIPLGQKVILTVGRLEAEKDFSLLLSLFAGLDKTHSLVIIGQGSLLISLQSQANALGITERVYFVGFVGRDKIWNYFLDADAFVLLSKAEALGLVFWEAMHVGVPVIGSTADGIVETIGADKDRGCIWTSADGQQGFNEMVRFCVTPSAERDAMIDRARHFVDVQRSNSITLNDLPIFNHTQP